MSAFKIVSLLYEKSKLEDEHDRLAALKERLEQELESVNSPEYIEQQARSHLRLVKPGEILYILPESDGADSTYDTDDGGHKVTDGSGREDTAGGGNDGN